MRHGGVGVDVGVEVKGRWLEVGAVERSVGSRSNRYRRPDQTGRSRAEQC